MIDHRYHYHDYSYYYYYVPDRLWESHGTRLHVATCSFPFLSGLQFSLYVKCMDHGGAQMQPSPERGQRGQQDRAQLGSPLSSFIYSTWLSLSVVVWLSKRGTFMRLFCSGTCSVSVTKWSIFTFFLKSGESLRVGRQSLALVVCLKVVWELFTLSGGQLLPRWDIMSARQVYKEGTLLKRGKVNKQWKERHFVVANKFIHYFAGGVRLFPCQCC